MKQFFFYKFKLKVLADRINLKVTLNRGDYNRAWNVVALKDENSVCYLHYFKISLFLISHYFFQHMPPKNYMIDLMYEPGKIMPIESSDAIQYVKL